MIDFPSRRAFIRGAALTGAAAALTGRSQSQAARGSSGTQAPGSSQTALKAPSSAADLPVRLGIASYTFREFDSAHLIDFMHQLRTPYLNLKDVHLAMGPLDQVATQAAAYRATGLTVTSGGNITFAKDDDADIRAKFEYCKAAGISTLVCAPTHENLPRLETFVKEYNFRLAIHNHGPEDKNFPSPFDVLAAVKNLDPRIGLCIDLGHAMRAGADVVAAIHAAGPRLYDIHIKDLADSTSRESQVAVGEGLMPVRAVFEALIATKYAGNVDLEYEIHGDNPMPGVIESFAYMRGVLAGMGYK
ncbi:MAG: sugar phosphate isomerase/epimerase [Acidobacteriota bacterium]|nr:sugar phosphate isomerase/epimerase [Acidobacteriota bacterium]